MTDPVIPTPISPLPPAPLTTDSPEVFDDKAFPFADSLENLRDQVNAQSLQTNQNAVAAKEGAYASNVSAGNALSEANRATSEANSALGYRNTAGTHATTATTQAGIATTKAQEAATSAAQANSYKNDTQVIAQQAVTDSAEQVALATAQAVRAEEAAESIAEGPITSLSVYSGLKTGAVTLALSDLGAQATDAQMQAGALATPLLMSPAGVKAAVLANAPKTLVREQRTADAQLVKADTGKLIDITSGTFNQTFSAAETLGNGWWCYLRNSGTGDIIMDPNASELIDGVLGYIMYPGEVRLVQCDGVTLRTVVLNSFYKVFTTSGNFIKPPGYPAFEGLIWGGGQSGATAISTTGRTGGSGGACAPLAFRSGELFSNEAFTIGSGGLPVTANSSSGSAGGNSTFKSVTAYGGVGASGGTAFFANAIVDGPPLSRGTTSSASIWGGAAASNTQGSGYTVYGGGAGQSITSGGVLAATGSSIYGGQGGTTNASGTAPTDGQTPGGGGGASTNGTPSGAGARGELRIWGII